MKEKLKDSVIYDDNNDGYATIEELNGEAKIRANSDELINSNVDSLLSDYQGFKSESNIIFDNKQDKIDDDLITEDKTVTGAINEVKGTTDEHILHISQHETNISQNTNDISEIKADYIKSSELGDFVERKQDKTHDNLTTDDKSVVGAINEINTGLQDQKSNIIELEDQVTTNTNNITQNTNDITIIKSDYVKSDELDNLVDGKQDKIDCSLITNNKTVSGAINEIFKIIERLQNQFINNVNLKVQGEDFDENIVPVQERIKRLKNEIDFLNLQISEKESELRKLYEKIKSNEKNHY